jgi:CheY-like chemotaxis protein
MQERDRQRIRVLLVDDDRDVADSLAEVLRLLDYDVRVVYSGAEALGVAGKYRPDVVILDINMPGIDGLQAARELKRDRRLTGKPFIAHTASDEPLVRRVAADIGFRRTVIKGSQALTETINALLDVPEPSRPDWMTRKDE